MTDSTVAISTLHTLAAGCRALRSNLRSTLQIALFTMFLPQLAGEFYFDKSSGQVVDKLWEIADATSATAGYSPFAQAIMGFFSNYLILSIIIWTLFIAGYLSLVVLFVEFNRTKLPQTLKFALKSALSLIFPRGLIAAFLIMAFSILGQIVLPLFIFVGALALMAPVLIVAENLGGFAAIWQSIRMRYALTNGLASRWAVFFCLSGTVAVLYLGLYSLLYIDQRVQSLDLLFGLPRALWSSKFGNFPFSIPFALGRTMDLAGTIGLVCLLPPATVHLYYQVKQRVSLLV